MHERMPGAAHTARWLPRGQQGQLRCGGTEAVRSATLRLLCCAGVAQYLAGRELFDLAAVAIVSGWHIGCALGAGASVVRVAMAL